jgi:hypothetical protein
MVTWNRSSRKERTKKDQNRRKYFQIESELQIWVEDVFAPDNQPENCRQPYKVRQEQAERGVRGMRRR